MRLVDWLTIIAIFLGPVVAVRVTRFLDEQREIRERKLQIFKTLMATRAYTVSWPHVEALNRIDLEFDKDNKGEKAVIEAWKAYHDLLGNDKIPMEQWGVMRVDLLVELLYKMAVVLDYDFDKTHIKNSSYSPRAHGDLEQQQETIRRLTIELLQGKRVLPMFVTNLPMAGRQPEAAPQRPKEPGIEPPKGA
jgi:hypothetical protein